MSDATEQMEKYVLELAKRASGEAGSSYALNLAQAAAAVAEARAWLVSPNQPHGGASNISVRG